MHVNRAAGSLPTSSFVYSAEANPHVFEQQRFACLFVCFISKLASLEREQKGMCNSVCWDCAGLHVHHYAFVYVWYVCALSLSLWELHAVVISLLITTEFSQTGRRDFVVKLL